MSRRLRAGASIQVGPTSPIKGDLRNGLARVAPWIGFQWAQEKELSGLCGPCIVGSPHGKSSPRAKGGARACQPQRRQAGLWPVQSLAARCGFPTQHTSSDYCGCCSGGGRPGRRRRAVTAARRRAGGSGVI
ncbi:hypothetical protein E2562_004850 [Oryza meyeriana var. granulata]|uniref:Uncharacterized protein n=1 Tax=Oryza meyeriana var. granulata TaxID=110450 RepID=A0A6G1DEG9_9ORYZ|nr:hypothetical protein E2562_004850 [Oryza meyeriana var. granulata]